MALVTSIPRNLQNSIILCQPLISAFQGFYNLWKWKNPRVSLLWIGMLILVYLIPHLWLAMLFCALVFYSVLKRPYMPQSNIGKEVRDESYKESWTVQLKDFQHNLISFNQKISGIYGTLLETNESIGLSEIVIAATLLFFFDLASCWKQASYFGMLFFFSFHSPLIQIFMASPDFKEAAKLLNSIWLLHRIQAMISAEEKLNQMENLLVLHAEDFYLTKSIVVLEHQRWWLGLDWIPEMLASDPAPWTDEGLAPISKENIVLPNGFVWLDDWKAQSPWMYSETSSGSYSSSQSVLSVVRKRIWRRRAAIDLFKAKYSHLRWLQE